MAKDSFYFSHDYNARNDEKIIAVRMRYGMEGYGIYFALLEKLRECADYKCLKDYDSIAFDLRADASKIKDVVEDFGLFAFSEDGLRFYSESFSRRMSMRDEIAKKRSDGGKKGAQNRWKNGPDYQCVGDLNIGEIPHVDNSPITHPSKIDNNKRKGNKSKGNKSKGNNKKEIEGVQGEGEKTDTPERENKLDVHAETFDTFRKAYPGTKRGLKTEFDVLKKHKDWREVVMLLSPALETQKRRREDARQRGSFVPNWKNLSTWLNQRCWEEELNFETQTKNDNGKSNLHKRQLDSSFD
jgi:hypothetical protein